MISRLTLNMDFDRDWIIPCLKQIRRNLPMQAAGSTAFRQTKQPLRDLLPLGHELYTELMEQPTESGLAYSMQSLYLTQCGY